MSLLAIRVSSEGVLNRGLETGISPCTHVNSLLPPCSATAEANRDRNEKTLFKEVDHHLLREQIVRDAPELAGERKRLSDEENAVNTVTIHLDGLDGEAVIHLVTKAMRDVGASERDIEGFREDANQADYDTMLAKAIGWGAPVCFLKDGQPWVRGDWRRLTLWQRVKRRFCLWRGSYVHPDGTVELSDKRA